MPNGDGGADALRPYTHHGIDLTVHGAQGIGDCPFCGAHDKFSVATSSGLWRCWVCGGGTSAGGGNALSFVREYYLRHAGAPECAAAALAVARDRRLCLASTVAAWGIVGGMAGAWLVPGYNTDGRLDQVYRRIAGRLLPTPGLWPEGRAHALHYAPAHYQASRPALIVCEGPWDGMALWETMGLDGEGTHEANVVATPGCNVWRDEWSEMARGKHVTLMYDSDQPRSVEGSKVVARAGYDGMHRVAKRLSGIAASIRWLKWGPDGYDASKPSGWDVRDALTGAPGVPLTMPERHVALRELLTHVEDVPADWGVSATASIGRPHIANVESRPCETWAVCEAGWTNALEWRIDMSDALAVILAVCASTRQGGNQLFVQLIGSAGSGKTTMCDGLLVSEHCHSLEHLTGFHSGYKMRGGDTDNKDCSLISRINGKTLVTPEADVVMSSPRFQEIMAQQRRIFDGKSGATYKNTDKDMQYVGLRTPWIMAGTPSMMDHDQSHLGDRFLRFIINNPEEAKKRSILRSALRSERVALLDASNGTAGSVVDPKTRTAHALTGGYVDWLRAYVDDRIARVDVPADAEDHCIDLAELSADLRARPNEDKRKREVHDCKELPTRLARQNIRLAICLAVTLNKENVDKEVMRIVRKVALSTAYGHSLDIVQWLCAPNPKTGGVLNYQESGGLMEAILTTWTGMTPERLVNYLVFLRKMDVLELQNIPNVGGTWVLTERAYSLYLRVMGN